jgi:hypothetical protein
MILRDEDGRAIGIERVSDLTDEIADIEKVLNAALKNKKKNIPMPQEEKDALARRLEDLKILMPAAAEDIKAGANAMEIISFIKEMAKLKKITEKLAECVNND